MKSVSTPPTNCSYDAYAFVDAVVTPAIAVVTEPIATAVPFIATPAAFPNPLFNELPRALTPFSAPLLSRSVSIVTFPSAII